jgi:predicted unusual protein kinase regulating ubiquinone biosynthesis (AarF/ABC1/UbiB family)
MIREFRKALMEELDYEVEANHLRTLERNLAEFRRIIVPAPIDSYVSRRVLTMDYVRGTKVTALNPVALIDVDPEGLADELIKAYLHQILIDGFFHADPHPGNVFITEDGRLALIDLGMVGHLSPTLQDKLLKLILAISEGRGEDAADAAIALGEKREEFDEDAFKRDVVATVGRYFGASLEEFQVGRIVLEVNQSAGVHGIKSPVELTMLGKTLLTLDNIARTLAPALDVNASIRTNASSLMQRRLLKSLSPGTVFTTMLEAKEFAEQLPRRINRVLESLASSQLKLKVEVIDEGAVIDGLQKVANRITMGLVVAALILSAAMMMRIESRFTLLGYPGFPIVLMLVAGSLAAWLVFNILAHDRAPRSKTRF